MVWGLEDGKERGSFSDTAPTKSGTLRVSVGRGADLGLEAGPPRSHGPGLRGRPGIGIPSGRRMVLEPVGEGGGGEGSRDWQPTRPPCQPQQEGRGDKRTELSGGSRGGGSMGPGLSSSGQSGSCLGPLFNCLPGGSSTYRDTPEAWILHP